MKLFNARCVLNLGALAGVVFMIGCETQQPIATQKPSCQEYVEWVSAGETDPGLRVLQPNGGEQLPAGMPCTVRVSSQEPADVIVQLEIDGVRFTPDELRGSKRVHRDTSMIFAIPAHFTYTFFDTTVGMPRDTLLGTESASCRIRITQYESPEFFDVSDCYFAIRN